MPSFSQGDTVVVAMDANDTLTFKGEGVCTITQPNNNVSTVRFNRPQATIGPFASGVSLSILCSSSGSYTKLSTSGDATVGETLSILVIASTVLGPSSLDTVVDCNSSSPIILTIPVDAVLGIENTDDRRVIAGYQMGTGAVSFAAGAGVTIRGTPPTAAQYSTVGLMHVGANEWAYL